MWKHLLLLAALTGAAQADDTATALAAWDASCPTPAADGSCVAAEHATGRQLCSPADVNAVARPIARDRTAARALDALRAARPTDSAERARVALALADASFESFASLSLPTNLSFDPTDQALRRRSMQRFDAWAHLERHAQEDLVAKYKAVIAIGDPPTEIAALERIARVSEAFVGALMGAPVPASMATDARDAYCDTLAVAAPRPGEAPSVADYEACLCARDGADVVRRARPRLRGRARAVRARALPCCEREHRAEPSAPPITEGVEP